MESDLILDLYYDLKDLTLRIWRNIIRQNHTLCVAMVIRMVEFPAILTTADPS